MPTPILPRAIIVTLLSLVVVSSITRAELILKQDSVVATSEAEIADLIKAAQAGDADAALKLGVAYFDGTGVEADAQQAEEWLKKAIQGGNREAATRLGYLYLRTSNQGKDVERASKGLEILRTGASEEASANITLGLLHLVGNFVPQDFDKAAGYFRKASEMGEADGDFYLGQIHSGEVGFEDRIQPEKAIEYLTRSFEGGDFDAARLLVKMLREGKYVPKNETRAFEIVSQAADRGNVEAQHFMGDLYESGAGIDKDLAKARDAYTTAAEAGLAQSQNKLGLIYGQGQEGLEPDLAKSEGWFQKAADQGFAPAHLNLALLIDRKGSPTSEDSSKASAHLITAAGAGMPEAQDRLGAWYRDGRHVQKDLVAASSWFKPAANAGNLNSKINLAQLLEITAQEAEAIKTALQLYIDAGNAGHPVAHFHIARMLLSGRLGLIDPVTAYAHLAASAEAGLAISQEALPKLKVNLNEEQMAKGEELKAQIRVVKIRASGDGSAASETTTAVPVAQPAVE